MTTKSWQEKWIRNDTVLWRLASDRVVVLRAGGQDVLSLDPTGRAVWDALDRPATLQELADRLAARYAAPRDQVERDVHALLLEMEHLQLAARTAS